MTRWVCDIPHSSTDRRDGREGVDGLSGGVLSTTMPLVRHGHYSGESFRPEQCLTVTPLYNVLLYNILQWGIDYRLTIFTAGTNHIKNRR